MAGSDRQRVAGTGSSDELMGGVLVYMEPVSAKVCSPSRGHWPTPPAAIPDRARRRRGPADADRRLRAADVVLEVPTRRSRITAGGPQAVLGARQGASSGPRSAAQSTTPVTIWRGPRRAATGRPFVGYCVELTVDGGEAEAVSACTAGTGGDVADAASAVLEVNAGALHPSRASRVAATRSTWRRPPSWTT